MITAKSVDTIRRLSAKVSLAMDASVLKELADDLDALRWDGCLTGDCPHSRSSECDAHLADEYRKAFAV